MEKEIKGFKLYEDKTTMQSGYLYYKRFLFKAAKSDKERMVRVYLPQSYDGIKKYPVLYMFDGQNMVNKYTTMYGDWMLDQTISSLKKNIEKECILVGIDSPNNDLHRTEELISPFKADILECDINISELFFEFIINEVKPYVEDAFNILKGRKYTGIGGSSMGGLASYYFGNKYNHLFTFCMNFSPAFCLYNEENFYKVLNSVEIKDDVKNFFFVGGKEGFDNMDKFTYLAYGELKKKYTNKDNISFVYDSNAVHNEACWFIHAFNALNTFLKDLKY